MNNTATLLSSTAPLSVDTRYGSNNLSRVAYRMAEIPAVTGRGLSTAYRDAKVGRLKVRKCGRSTIVLASDLMEWLAGEAT
jgi:hypothetical protein